MGHFLKGYIKFFMKGTVLAVVATAILIATLIFGDFSLFTQSVNKPRLLTSQQLSAIALRTQGMEYCKGSTAAGSDNSNLMGQTDQSKPPAATANAWDTIQYTGYYRGMPRKCIIGSFASDWGHIAYLINNTTVPFAIVRYGDGERNLIQGQGIGQDTQAFSEDKFWFQGGESELGKDLQWSLTGHFGQQFFYGFASPHDDAEGLRWYLQHTEQLCSFITYANIFVNSNYPRTKALLEIIFQSRLAETVLIANYEGLNRFLSQVTVPAAFKYMRLPDDAPHVYVGATRLELIKNVTTIAKAVKNRLFIVAGGPMAKPLIAHMWAANPNNQYVDFGSSVDELLKGRRTRPYMTPGNEYSNQVDPPYTVDDLDRPVLVNYDYLGRR